MNNTHRLPHELSEDERLGGIVRPILAQMFTRHTQKINEWLTQRLSAFDFENKKAIDRVRQDLAFPQYIPEGPKILVGEDAPTKGLGTNGDNYFRTSAGNATELYAKISGSWVLKATIPQATAGTIATATTSPAHATYLAAAGVVNGSNTVFTMPTAYVAGTMRPSYFGAQQVDFTETDPATGVVTMGFAPIANSGNEMQFNYEPA